MSSGAVFDYQRLAAVADQAAALLASVTDRLVEHASGLAAGATVLDIACGAGEPGLTVAERFPGVRLLGIDAAEPMIDVAREKARARGLADARFEVMDSQDLVIDDGAVDVVLSRFGVLSYADPVVEAREIARVLRPGGWFSIATLDAGSKNTLAYATGASVREWLPDRLDLAAQRLERFAMPGRREAWLTRAGLVGVESELWSWTVKFPDEPSMWDRATGHSVFGRVLAGLDDDQLAEARAGFGELLADYRRPDGSYLLPYACRLIWGSRAPRESPVPV